MDVGVFCISTHVSSFPPPLFAAMMFSPIALSCTLLPFHRGWLMTRGSQDLGVLFLPCLFVLSVFHSYRLGIKRHPDPTGSLYACYLQRIIWTASGRNLGKSVNYEFCSLSSQTFHLTCILFSHFFTVFLISPYNPFVATVLEFNQVGKKTVLRSMLRKGHHQLL